MKTVGKRIRFITILTLMFAVILTGIIFSFGNANGSADAVVTSGNIGSLTISDYATRTEGSIIDKQVLDKLYGRILGTNGTGTYSQVVEKLNSTSSTITATAKDNKATDVQPNSMNFAQLSGLSGIADRTEGNPITLGFGGYTWNVVYLTTNTTNNDLIATLWMTDVISSFNQKWHSTSSTANPTASTNSTNTYSTSYIRKEVLNKNGKFTQFNSGGKLASYIAHPNQVKYQEKENWVWSYSGTGNPSLLPNEAWGAPDETLAHTSGSKGWYSAMAKMDESPNYFQWAQQDYIWLPSITEMGYKRDGSSTYSNDASYCVSLWGIPNSNNNSTGASNAYVHNILKSSTSMWSRSGGGSSPTTVLYVDANGGGNYGNPTATNIAIRPALHLNLTEANKNAGYFINDPATNVDNKTYNGDPQGMDTVSPKPSWWTADFEDSNKIKFTYYLNGEKVSEMRDAGDYWIKTEIVSDYKTPDGFPCYFYGNGKTEEGHEETPTVRWFKFKINPKAITPTLSIDETTKRPKAELATGTIYDRDTGDKSPTLGFVYTKSGGGTPSYEWPQNDPGTYTITPRITNADKCKNYVIVDPFPSPLVIDIKKSPTFDKTKDKLVWQATETGGTAKDIADNKLTYSPKGYTISIGANILGGGTLQEKGVKVSVIKVDNVGSATTATVQNAKTSYALKVTLVNADGYETFSEDIEYTLTVEQAKYDLSQVKWDYSETAFTYDGTSKTIALNDKLPSNLTPVYSGTRTSSNVAPSKHNVKVESFTNSDTTNYVTPLYKDTTTYVGSFDWEYQWNIVPKTIDTSSTAWHDKDYNFKGTDGQYPVLDSSFDSLVSYSFEKYNETSDSYEPIALEDIEVNPSKAENFRVTVTATNPNYKVNTENNTNKKVFSLGTLRYPVTVTVTGSGQPFNNTARKADFTIGGDGASYVTKADFTVTYYSEDGTTPLAGAPTHAGNYKVKVSLNSNKTDIYIQSGGEMQDFTVAKASVDFSSVKWNFDSENPFEFQREGGANKNHKVELVGWDDQNPLHTYVKGFVSYSGELEECNVKSKYEAHYALDISQGALDLNDFDDLESALPAKDLDWKIVKRQITPPSYSGDNLVFDNKDVNLIKLLGIPDDYAEYFTVSVKYNDSPIEGHSAKNAGKYTVTCSLLSDPDIQSNVCWDKDDMLPKIINVTVDRRTVEIKGWTNSAMPSPIVDDEADLDFIERTYTNTNGDPVTLSEIASQYNTTFRVKAESKFGDNVIVCFEENVLDYADFSTPADPNVPAQQVDKPTLVQDTLAYTGAPVTFELEGFNGSYMIMVGSLTVTDAGDYDIIIRFLDGANYCWDDGSRDPITLTMHLTDDPDAPVPAPKEPSAGEKIKAFFNGLIEKHFPLWQVITIAVGGLLSVIFLIKSVQYGNRKKKAKGELKKYAPAKAMATLLPIFSTEVVAGLSNQIWSILAFSIAGVTVLMFIIALVTRKGWKKAELAKEEAMASAGYGPQGATMLAVANNNALDEMRRELRETLSQVRNGKDSASDIGIEEILRRQREEMESRHREEMNILREEQRRENQRREEEQAKRDEAMKLMLANMMGRQQGADGMDMGYASMDNTDLLVQKVIAGLLPMVQQMIPEPTAYLSAPSDIQNDRYDTLTSVLQQQNDALQQQNAQIVNLQNQIADMSRNVLEAEIIPDHSEEIRAMADEHNAQIAEQNAQIAELQSQIADLSQGRLEAEILPDQSEELRDLEERHNARLEEQNAQLAVQNAEIAELKNQIAMMSSMSVDELDDEDFDDEEEWDSILDEDDDDFVEAVIIDDNGNVRKTYPNFRMRLKQSSDKNREWYAVIKNMFCSQKGVTYRVYKRVEKIRYQGQVVGVIGIAKRSIKLWLALKPYEYDARRYHHKDVSDKPRFVDVPMYVRITSDRALLRAEELILALFQELNMEARKRYNDRSIQELIFTLKHNRLLTNKQYKSLLCETMHVHDCDVLDDETAEKCIENKHVDSIDDSYIATIKLDDIDLNFQDGNRVTLERLKKVGLVPEDCTGFTVTAGQRLTKPLIIVANDFTLDAVKLITLTGGRAIRLTLV